MAGVQVIMMMRDRDREKKRKKEEQKRKEHQQYVARRSYKCTGKGFGEKGCQKISVISIHAIKEYYKLSHEDKVVHVRYFICDFCQDCTQINA